MDTYINQLAGYLFAQSWQIATLTVGIALITLALRNKSAHIRYLLWLIVLAKCLIPPLYSVPVAVLPEQPHSEHLMAPVFPETPSYQIMDTTSSESMISEANVEPHQAEPTMLNTTEIIVLAWLAGLVLFLIWIGSRAIRYTLWLQSRRTSLSPSVYKSFQELFNQFKLKRPPKIWLSKDIAQPFVWGLFRGSVYLPVDFADSNNQEQNRTILAHELSHIARFDAAINVFQVAAQAIYWFHPFVWWVNRKIRQEREKCCDEMAVVQLNALPEHYTGAIVETLAAERKSAHHIPSLAIVGSIKDIEERIRTMLRPGKKFYKRPSVIAIVILLLVAAFTIPIGCALTRRAGAETAMELEEQPTRTLHQAAADGDIELVKTLISQGANVNATDMVWTPLMYASENGYKDIAELLISKGADVNAKPSGGWTALMSASENGYKDIAELLISKGADVNAKSSNGWWTPLHCAASEGQRDVAELLISKGADVNAKTNAGTPLHSAAEKGDKQTVELLLSKGADINAKNNRDSSTPLLVAMTSISSTWSGRKDVVELLVEKGAKVPELHIAAYMGDMEKLKECLQDGTEVDAQDDFGSTALLLAANSGNKDIMEFLVSKGANFDTKDTRGWTPMHYAAARNYNDIADLLLAKGANINAMNNRDNNRTPLHVAATEGHKDMVELLLAKGADVDAKNSTGGTPLFYAASEGHRDVAELLISKGADVNSKNRWGWTPLHNAASGGHKDVVELLINKGVDINVKNNFGVTPWSMAIATDYRIKSIAPNLAIAHKEIAELLRKHGAKEDAPETLLLSYTATGDFEQAKLLISQGVDVNAKGNNGFTALHHVASFDHREIAELLITNGANINAKNIIGLTPLFMAIDYGHKYMVELLIAKGADVNIRNNAGRTALDLAEQNGHTEIAELLREHGAENGSPTEADGAISTQSLSLHEAAAASNIELVKLLISKTATYINAKDEDGRTALYIAADRDHIDIAKFLIDNGANVNATDRNGVTPLHRAVSNNNKEMVRLILINKGTDINAKNNKQQTALSLAKEKGNTEIVELLREHGAEEDSSSSIGVDEKKPTKTLHEAAADGDMEKVKNLLDQGTDINLRDPNGLTALHLATRSSHKEVVELLINQGANINIQDVGGFTPLNYAIWGDEKGIVELLIAKGANINTEDMMGFTPLYYAAFTAVKDISDLLLTKITDPTTIHFAACKGDLADVKTFIEESNDVNVNSKDKFGCTPLHWAVLAETNEVADFLITKGADVNAKDNLSFTPLIGARRPDMIELLSSKGADLNTKLQNGRTKLHGACYGGQRDLVELLITDGADVNIKDQWGNTPLHLAVSQGHMDIIELLIANGANVNTATNGGRTPLFLAEQNGHTEIAELLREHGAKD